MKLRLYVPNTQFKSGELFVLPSETYHHAINVLRKKEGDILYVFNAYGEYLAEIEACKKGNCIIKILDRVEDPYIKDSFIKNPQEEALKGLTLFCCLVKPTAMKEIVEKATEMGVHTIQPLLSKYTATKDFFIEKLEKVAISATEQCGRLEPPLLLKPKLFASCISSFVKQNSNATILLANRNNNENVTIKKSNNIACIIGCEGGLSKEEIEFCVEMGAVQVNLGSYILRAETAVTALLALAVGS